LKERAAISRNADHHRQYGEFLLGRSEPKEARFYVLNAIKLDPENPHNYLLLGRWREGQGEYKLALRAYEAALERSPDDNDIRSYVGAAHVKLGKHDEAFAQFSRVLGRAPAHLETLIRLGDLYVDVGDESDDDSAYDKAIEAYNSALSHHTLGTGSKFLSSSEKAAILYQRGYCRVKLYEATPNAFRSRRLLNDAKKDFRECLDIDGNHEKARRAIRRLTDKNLKLAQTIRERYGPWIILTCALFVFLLAQQRYIGDRISSPAHLALTFGAIVLAIAGLFLPELLKLKVAGVELEKSPVEQQRRPTSFNLSR
jgi:tetratricopeptide (TPR) repeat protein